MRPPLILIVRRVVAPLGEHLPGKAVPVPQEQRLLLRLRQHAQAGQIPRRVFQQLLIVVYRRRYKHPVPLHFAFFAVRPRQLHLLHHPGHGRRHGDEPLLDPSVPRPARVRACPHVHPRPRPAGTVAGEKIAVFLPGEVRQLVKGDVVIPLALVVDAILHILHGPEVNLRPGGERPEVLRPVVPRPGKGRPVNLPAPVNELRQLRIRLAQNQPPIVGNVYLPQRLAQQRVGLSAPRRAPVQHLILRPGHEPRLLGLRLPYLPHPPFPPPGAAAPRRPRPRPFCPAPPSAAPASAAPACR